MLEIAQTALKPALEVARIAPVQQALNGICYASYGENQLSATDLERMVQAVPLAIATALTRKAYYFVPLTLGESSEAGSGETLVASNFTTEWSDQAICHRNVDFNGAECVFISTRLMQDRFALAFEFYINAGHHFVDGAGVPESFMTLVGSQAQANVRGETSQDAWEQRARALGSAIDSGHALPANSSRAPRPSSNGSPAIVLDEKAHMEYMEAAFADAIAIYLLALTVDFDYTELREREYPLLAAQALAERLRHVAQLFPPNPGYEFSIRYRRRNS